MKPTTTSILYVALVLAVLSKFGNAFTSSSSFAGTSMGAGSLSNNAGGHSSRTITMEYIPSGMSKEQYRKLKEQEKKKNQGKNLGKVGITTFKSRSFSDWQKSGGKNLFPVDPNKVKNPKDLPYMQRPGGAADDSDLGGKKGGFGALFGGFGKKKQSEPVPEEEKKTNWWTLN